MGEGARVSVDKISSCLAAETVATFDVLTSSLHKDGGEADGLGNAERLTLDSASPRDPIEMPSLFFAGEWLGFPLPAR